MAVLCARVSALASPGYAAAPQQTPDGKGGRNQSRHLGGRSPSAAPPTAARKWALLKVQELFPGFESRPPRPQWQSSRRRRDAARLLVLHLTRRPQSRAASLLAAPSPLLAAFRSSFSREGSGREGKRRQAAGTRWPCWLPSSRQVSKQ